MATTTKRSIELESEQIETIELALDALMRLGMGQFDVINSLISTGVILHKSSNEVSIATHELNEDARDITRKLEELLGYDQSTLGIFNPKVNTHAKRAYDLKQLLKKG
ncbi:TPA: hypothetical protein I7730_16295 [Vibrio vulnificus]|uniref:Uncharacterized protein n=1 Tax=Vibrio vulnificus TaxID=672 RepID=A0A8H9TGS1_VIBVL|nr:hypothetical protein [Vibrio vulnificus]HAS8541345.1 hypothetical protein [Vibrio vulnificus]